MTEAPATITYSSLVCRETVRITLMIAALNDFDFNTADILNACVQAPVIEKVWTILDLEFGKDTRKSAEIIKALYGLKLE